MIRRLDDAGRRALAASLAEGPETTMPIHLLQRGLAEAFVAGTAGFPPAAVIQRRHDPAYPIGLGDDAELLWAILRTVPGWEAANLPLALGEAFAACVLRDWGCATTPYEEPFAVLPGPVVPFGDPAVRRLGPDDLPLMEAAGGALEMTDWRFGSAALLVGHGRATGAVVDGRLASVAFTSALASRHAEVGVVTAGDHRNRGLATAAAALLVADLQSDGLIPVWSTAVFNDPSRRVAAKLGFREVSRRVYVDLERGP